MFVPVLNMYENYTESKDVLLASKEKLDALVDEDLEITKDIEYLKSDLGKEAEFRRRFRTGKEGEFMAIIVDAEDMRDRAQPMKEVGFWENIINKLKDIFN